MIWDCRCYQLSKRSKWEGKMSVGIRELIVLVLMATSGVAVTAAALTAFLAARKRRDRKER